VKIKEQILSIIEKIEDEQVLKDILNIVSAIYKHFVRGHWER
jgi:DNA-binding FrmR family transcriptional regulator